MSTDKKSEKQQTAAQVLALRPAELLQGEAASTWQAYNAMETTKTRHYALLEVLDNKKKNYNIDPTETDKQMLQFLLDDHSDQVKRFTEASKALKVNSPSAHSQLFDYIGVITTHQGMGSKAH